MIVIMYIGITYKMLQMPLSTNVSSTGVFSNEFNLVVIPDTDSTFMIVSDKRRRGVQSSLYVSRSMKKTTFHNSNSS